MTTPAGANAPDTTSADAVVAALVDAGVTRLFGVPGGGSSLDLVAAARRKIEEEFDARREACRLQEYMEAVAHAP